MLRIQRGNARGSVLPMSKYRTADFSGFTPGGGGGGGYGGGGGAAGSGTNSAGSGFGSSSSRLNDSMTYTPVIDFLDEGSVVDLWLSRAPERLHRLCRRIYAEDAVAGQAIDMYKDLPWSEFQLVGIQDPTILNFYTDALNAINAVSILPLITQEFLVMGKVIGHMIMDDRVGYFTSAIIHNPDHIRVTPSPISGFSPKLDIIASPSMQQIMMSTDARDKAVQQHLGPYADLIRNKKDIPLHPANSFYLPRQLAPYDSVGASIYTRIFALVAYEKALTNATLTTANRRISRIRHLTAGEENWEPTEEEMNAYAELFMDAEKDPVGALVATRTGVTVNEVGGNTLSDIVKLGDEWPFLTTAKMNALGISETFLSGEASYNSMEQVIGVFLDRIRAHRNFVTYRLLIDQILKPLAKKHKFIHTTKARLAHRIRVADSDDRTDYILPSIVYEKKLRPTENKDFLEVLATLEEKGFPITMRTWAATAGLDLQMEIDQMDDDISVRKLFEQQKQRIESVGSESGSSEEDSGTDEESGGEEGGLEGLAELSASSTAKEAAVRNATSLPHMRNGEFLGVTTDLLVERVEKLSAFLGGRARKPITATDYSTLLDTGNKNRNTALHYLLARAGILMNADVDPSFIGDAVRTLASMGLDADTMSREVTALYQMAQSTEKASKPVAQRTTSRRDLAEPMMLTGHTQPWLDAD